MPAGIDLKIGVCYGVWTAEASRYFLHSFIFYSAGYGHHSDARGYLFMNQNHQINLSFKMSGYNTNCVRIPGFPETEKQPELPSPCILAADLLAL